MDFFRSLAKARGFTAFIIIEFHKDLAEDDSIIMTDGIRDYGLLESAVFAPFQTFGGDELHPGIIDKAAQLAYGLAKNHGFVDGNKRTAVHAMLMLLLINDIRLDYEQNELVELAVNIAEGMLKPNEIAQWIESKL